MIIVWDGKDYVYDQDRGPTVKEAMPIKAYTGHGLVSWWRAVANLEPDAVQCLLWLVKRRNGEVCEIESLDFDIAAFVQAFNVAAESIAGEPAPKADSPSGSTV